LFRFRAIFSLITKHVKHFDRLTALNGKDMKGRSVTVNEARPRTDEPRRGGFGGGGTGSRRY